MAYMVCKPILVFSLSLSQAEQKLKLELDEASAIGICKRYQENIFLDHLEGVFKRNIPLHLE